MNLSTILEKHYNTPATWFFMRSGYTKIEDFFLTLIMVKTSLLLSKESIDHLAEEINEEPMAEGCNLFPTELTLGEYTLCIFQGIYG